MTQTIKNLFTESVKFLLIVEKVDGADKITGFRFDFSRFDDHPVKEFPSHGTKCRNKCNIENLYILTALGEWLCPLCGTENSQGDEETIFCNGCFIIYKKGCLHAHDGCTFDKYHATLVKSFKYGEDSYKYENAMPLFGSFKEYKKMEGAYTLDWVCTCKGNCADCTEAFYKVKINCTCTKHL